ncbi:PREDICTED: ribonuclease P protein subunit p21 [Rhagoletis zephyria]|uniref:ribonuclease P protein subunit p21 n=1 Tax=Rhagoletis zephyria TaxID=28612 RepID=UPI0008119BD7|nr:PREDICTED: ribonuclease P protein subunit p21 [Rhagoletis zephyria]XP_017465580.1 PREDICTED: ribonuclease P protein subunit p21 [Rhagoletis zephyria]XP_036338923.1 ribonuclease P protein subunit p21 [Rhagoletis pomonella]XP_036338924.1 ribonuclease P protein subunit p21 [Rhagoletis pomonella]
MSGKKHQAFQGKECFSRMNFLYQASMLMAGRNNTLAAYYGQLCRNIGKKAVLRIDPDLKRQFCKRCSLALQPGITADLNALSRRRRRKSAKIAEDIDENTSLQLTCRQCGFRRQYVVNPDHKFWLENDESVVESITVGNENTEHKQN